MADLQNTSKIDTAVSNKPALVTDLNSTYISNEQYSYARNAVGNSKEGDLGTIGNEPSNTRCFSAPYNIIGEITLPEDKVLIFSTDNVNSEIGVGDLVQCSYTKVLNSKCLNFNDRYPITGESKKDFQKGVIATFTDKFNPVRRVELNSLGSLVDCDDVLLFKKIGQPCINVTKGQVGNMPNGVYSAVIAYVVDNQIFSDWYSITNRTELNSETGSNSLEISVSNLDTEFKEFALGIVGNYIDPVTKGATKLAKKVGTYSTQTKTISVTDFINPEFQEIKLSELVVKKNTWTKAGIISSNANILLLADLVEREEENYQLKAMSIEAEYVVEQVEADYYEKDGIDVGYYRDENYDFYIEGVYNTGESTNKFHIGGRKATPLDRTIVSSVDVYEHDAQFADCIPQEKIERWRVENTASPVIPYNNPFTCGRRVFGHGKMGYVESTEPYANNVATYGDDAGTPIRFHKMPDESIIPRTSTINGKTYINILGVRFKNIPKFDSSDVVGYKITRSDRKGGNGTVVARGLMTNMRFYEDNQLNETVLFSNYPVNDLSPDVYLSATQTSYKGGKEHDYTPLTGYYKDKFSFYSPHTLFEPRYSLGNEVKIECEEIASVKGQFEKVYNHPQEKLLNQFAFWIASAVGAAEAALVLAGKRSSTGKSITSALGVASGVAFEYDSNFKIETVADLISLDIGAYIAAQVKAGAFDSLVSSLTTILALIASIGLKVPYSLLSGVYEADKLLDTIYNFTGYTDYVYQYNAVATFDRTAPVNSGNKRRRLIRRAEYIPSDVVSVEDQIVNNYFREKSVLLELNKPIADPKTKDNSRNTISGFKKCGSPLDSVTSTGAAFYATSKAINPNQYGRVGSASPVSMHSCVLPFGEDSAILYGGDCIIARMQFQKRMQFFNQNLANAGASPGTEYDYRRYRNIAYPRYWMDTSKYDFSQLFSSNVINFTKFSRTTTSKHNLDCKKGNDGGSPTRIDSAYMYLSNNCVLDFFVECDSNITFREKTTYPFYSKTNTNLSQIFRSDRLNFPEEFNLNRVYSDIYTTEISPIQQREDFDPLNPIPTNQPNSVIYSLPSFNLQQVDNWQYFLPANYFNFRESDFGSLTAIHKVDQDRIIFLFSKASPFISMGRSLLQLNGQTVTIGDGGIFAQDPRELMPTDNNYGACNSRYAFSNTHLGRYYPSEKQGRILNFADSLQDITRQGMSFWCKNYMPIFLYKSFPSYPQIENPITGVGYLTAFDSFNETIYICKRDFSPKKEYVEDITWDGVFKYKGKEIALRSQYFNDISWTLSYSPAAKAFVSWHDWHPDGIIQTDNHFMTIKGNTVWKHNESYESFCRFYEQDFPFEIEFVSSSGQQVHTVRSLEYLLEVYKYKNSGRDRFHVLNTNFDRLIVSNTEQISPLLKLVYGNFNPETNLQYPKKDPTTNVAYDILFFKEENKYRINMFWDSVKDRGEFTNAEVHLFPTDESGYKQIVNPVALDINKQEKDRKKFRHYFNKFRLTKTISGANKFIVKLLDIKKLISLR